MSRFVDIECTAVTEVIGRRKFESREDIQEFLDNIPTADVVEVRHGEWELKSEIHQLFDDVDENFYVECPICHRHEYVPFELTEEKMLNWAKEQYPYCHCGAKMDGGKME